MKKLSLVIAVFLIPLSLAWFTLPTAAQEVSHLREMNHSPEFWATVGSIFPEFEAAKLRLKTEPLPLFD